MNNKRVAILVVAFFCVVGSTTTKATEGGGTSKALGVDNVIAGIMPPPGFNLTNFLVYYTADRTLDSSGNDNPFLRNFELDVLAEVFRVRYILPDNIKFLGANVELRAGWNIVSAIDVSFDLQTPVGVSHREDSATDIGDSLLGIILGWHWKRFHQMLGPEFFLPTGKFDRLRLANTSRNYVSIGPSYWFTWFPIDEIEISGALIYLINLENPDTNYSSGNEISFDYNVGYSLTRDWQIGATGYLYKQIEDDEQNGRVFGDGNRGQVAAVGPFLRYHPHDKNFGVTVKWQHEEAVENRAAGERFFLQAAIQF